MKNDEEEKDRKTFGTRFFYLLLLLFVRAVFKH